MVDERFVTPNSPKLHALERRGETVVRRLLGDPVFRRSALKWFAGLAITSLAIAITGLYLIHQYERSRRLVNVRVTEQGIVFAQVSAVRERLSAIQADVQFLRDEYERFLKASDDNAESANAQAKDEFINFSKTHGSYDQIRVIATNGMEIFRINHSGGSPVEVFGSFLQDKSSRPYVKESLNLDRNEIYISPLDLNMDNDLISQPIKPTIRFSMPVETASGTRFGLMILNYLATSILSKIEGSAELSSGSPMMLNSDGYWLVAPERLPKWGFVYPEHQNDRMPAVYPKTWAALSDDAGQVLTSEGLFSYQIIDPHNSELIGADDAAGALQPPISPRPSGIDQRWYIGTFVAADKLSKAIGEPSRASEVYGALILLLCVIGSATGALAIAEVRHYGKTLEHLARYDSLTGLLNRRSLEEQLDVEIARAERTGRHIVVAFLDIDGFKTINDELGHAEGDRALIDIAEAVEANIRAYDVAARPVIREPQANPPMSARMGGDEFVVVLPDVREPANAQTIVLRIRDAIRALSWQGYKVGVSIGIATFPEQGRTRDALLEMADKAMYAAKQSGKDRIVVAEPIPTTAG